MKLQPNQIQVTMGKQSKTYTFNHGHCDVTDEAGQWVAGGIHELGCSAIFLDVVERGYSIDERNLDVLTVEDPEIGQQLQLHLHKTK